MAEQLRTTKGLLGDRAQIVQGPRHQLFPGARGSADKNGTEMGRHPANLGKHIQHGRTAADNSFELAGVDQFVIEAVSSAPFLGPGQELCNPPAAGSPHGAAC